MRRLRPTDAINDQVIGIGQMVVPGTPRDSLFILDALLNLDGGVKPEMVAGGTLRPLRDPDAAGLDDDEDGAEN